MHGDFRIGNVIFGPEASVPFSTGFSHIGDPVDLGWLCVRAWRFGNDVKPVGGIGEREASPPTSAGGAASIRHLRFWAFGNLKWAIISHHHAGEDASRRRTAETGSSCSS